MARLTADGTGKRDAAGVPPARVVLLAGASGSGKSWVARRTGLPVLALDDFYADGDDPTLPRLPSGAVDWDDARSWRSADAVAAIVALCVRRRAEVPVYAIAHDRAEGVHVLDVGDAPAFVAEGVFAAEIVVACRTAGVVAGAYVLRRPRQVTLVRRLVRDLREARKAPGVLVRRGWRLMRAEPDLFAHQVACGCLPRSAGEILRDVAALGARSAPRRRARASPWT